MELERFLETFLSEGHFAVLSFPDKSKNSRYFLIPDDFGETYIIQGLVTHFFQSIVFFKLGSGNIYLAPRAYKHCPQFVI